MLVHLIFGASPGPVIPALDDESLDTLFGVGYEGVSSYANGLDAADEEPVALSSSASGSKTSSAGLSTGFGTTTASGTETATPKSVPFETGTVSIWKREEVPSEVPVPDYFAWREEVLARREDEVGAGGNWKVWREGMLEGWDGEDMEFVDELV